MFDPKMADETDNDILKEIIQMCEQHMGGGLKKPEVEAPAEAEESKESPIEASSEKPDMEDADLEELMRMYESSKG